MVAFDPVGEFKKIGLRKKNTPCFLQARNAGRIGLGLASFEDRRPTLFDDLPEIVKTEVQAFADVNIAWLKKTLVAAKVASPREAEKRARAIYSGIMGAQLMARSRADISLYDSLIESYRTAGLFPV